MYSLPVVLIGANVGGRPTYFPIAYLGIASMKTISLDVNKSHYTNRWIIENKSFSVNIPSECMVVETYYWGLVSGKDADKGALFNNFYGKLKTAPMIEECPLNMECRLVKNVDMETHDLFIDEVVETYCDERVLIKGVVDYSKISLCP